MHGMDRRKFLDAAICGAGAVGRLADRMKDDVKRAQVVVVPGARVVAAGSAGGIAAAAFAAGAGSDEGERRP